MDVSQSPRSEGRALRTETRLRVGMAADSDVGRRQYSLALIGASSIDEIIRCR